MKQILVRTDAAPRSARRFIHSATVLLSALWLGLASSSVYAQSTNVVIDPAKTWLGFMNVSELPDNGGGYDFGQVWGTADLAATITSGGVITMTPNTSIDRDVPTDPYWWNADGSPNKIMDASFYVEDDTLAGQTVTFSGYVWTNTLAAPYSAGATIFIKDLSPGFATVASVTTNVAPGAFSLTLATTGGDHVQYGIELIGPDARLTNLAALGKVILASNPPAAGPTITTALANTSVLVGSTAKLSVAANGSGLKYVWTKDGVILTNGGGVSGATGPALSLSTVTGAAEATYAVIVSNTGGSVTNSAYLTVLDPNHLTPDQNAPWIGYMNVSNLPQNGGAYQFGKVWATADLNAAFAGGVLTLTPNTSISRDVATTDPFWWNPDGSGNEIMDASFYQQFDGLAGKTVTFAGYCAANSLVAPYVSTVFVKDFVADYSSSVAATVPLVPGQPFSVTLATKAGDHIQWGFETVGPNASLAAAPALGQVLVTAGPVSLAANKANGTLSLNFATNVGLKYTVQYKTSLNDTTWKTLATVTGTGTAQTVTDPANQASRFYRLSVQ